MVVAFFLLIQDKDVGGKCHCPVCHQLRTASDKTASDKIPDGKIHWLLRRSNAVWCPYASNPGVFSTKRVWQPAMWW